VLPAGLWITDLETICDLEGDDATVAVEGDEILLNGDPVTLAGVNREGSHPDWGQAEPLRIQRAEIEAIVDAGFAVRGLSDTLAGTSGAAPVRTTDYTGLLTAYRQPKAAYDALRRILEDR